MKQAAECTPTETEEVHEVQEIHHAQELGALTIGEELTLVVAERGRESPLNTLQCNVMSMLSMGHSSGRIADRLEVSKRGVERAKVQILERLEVPTMTVGMHIAIQRGIISVPSVPDQVLVQSVSTMDRKFINLFAQGVTSSVIAEKFSVTVRAITSYEQDIFRKLGARTKAHAIRRAHELGILV